MTQQWGILKGPQATALRSPSLAYSPFVAAAGFANAKSLTVADAAELYSRTQGAGDSRQKMTFSFWIKPDASIQNTGQADLTRSNTSEVDVLTVADINAADVPNAALFLNSGGDGLIYSDVNLTEGSWNHVVVQIDTANATASSRVRIWNNGTEDATLQTIVGVTQNYDTGWGLNAGTETILNLVIGTDTWIIDEFSKIDNQLLTPTSFATANAPKDISGLTFGAQGYWIRFETGVAATGGNDSSGNGLNFTNTNYDDADFTADVPA